MGWSDVSSAQVDENPRERLVDTGTGWVGATETEATCQKWWGGAGTQGCICRNKRGSTGGGTRPKGLESLEDKIYQRPSGKRAEVKVQRPEAEREEVGWGERLQIGEAL